MGKASSNKKVARAAKAGGGRARAAGERNLLFPVALVLVVVLGTLLVVYARENRSAEALEPPVANQDHWHAAYGFYLCDEFLPALPEFEAPRNGGIHSHGDGLVHIHPFSTARAGENATLANWMVDAGEALGSGGTLSDDSVSVPGGETYTEGTDSCEGGDGDPIVQVLYWPSADDGGDPIVFTEDFGDLRFRSDREAFVIAFAPEGADIPLPPTVTELDDVSDVDPFTEEAPSETTEPTETTVTTEPTETTETTATSEPSTTNP